MRLERREAWDEVFFERFRGLRNRLYRGEPHFLEESLDELRTVFGPGSPFESLLAWEALLLVDAGGEAVGRLVVSYNRRAELRVLSCGWLECDAGPEAARLLFERAEARAREWGCGTLKAPVQGHFFHSYRLKLPGGGEPFYGEPLHRDAYHGLLEACGFRVADTWDTHELKPDSVWSNFRRIRRALPERPANYRRLKARYLRLDRWEQELPLVFDLFTRSYASMPEFEPITFEAFRALYDSFRHLAHPLASYIVEYEGEPVGFCICYFDPLEVLLDRQRSAGRGWLPERIAGPLRDLRTLARLKLNRRKLLIAYVGRVTPQDGGEIKGIQALVSPRIYALIKLLRVQTTLVTYSASGSMSRKSFDEATRSVCSRYALYRKDLGAGGD